jgi:hypothetical protein
LSAAVANTSNLDEFTQRYQGLLEHYDLLAEKTNPNCHRRSESAVDRPV